MDKIEEIFYCFFPIDKEIDSLFFSKSSFSQKIYDPPSYIIDILFFNVLGCIDFGPFDKIRWHTYFSYKNVTFLIHDYKFGSTTIRYENNDSSKASVLKELLKKIQIASKLIDKELRTFLEEEIAKENFYIRNSYANLKSIYDFYKDKYIKTRKRIANLSQDKKSFSKDFNDSINKELRLERECQYYMFSVVLSFFSLSEFLLISLLCFSEKKVNYIEFKNLSWDERFIKIFNIDSNKTICKIYNELLEIRKEYRNPLSHGIWAQYEHLLVPLKNHGLLPISYEIIGKNMIFGIDKGISMNKVLNTFNIFFKYLNSDQFYRMVVRYLEFSFPIPFDKNRIKHIKKFMDDEDKFEEYLIRRDEYETAVINRDI
ncbi:MAG: hypothetical protein M1479_01280 [Actinobacteria bacterium]|nr:hypothetical protein [Actinomycetota bacterium]